MKKLYLLISPFLFLFLDRAYSGGLTVAGDSYAIEIVRFPDGYQIKKGGGLGLESINPRIREAFKTVIAADFTNYIDSYSDWVKRIDTNLYTEPVSLKLFKEMQDVHAKMQADSSIFKFCIIAKNKLLELYIFPYKLTSDNKAALSIGTCTIVKKNSDHYLHVDPLSVRWVEKLIFLDENQLLDIAKNGAIIDVLKDILIMTKTEASEAIGSGLNSVIPPIIKGKSDDVSGGEK